MSPLVHFSVRGTAPDEETLMRAVERGTAAALAVLERRLKTVEFRGVRGPDRIIALSGGRSIAVRAGAVGNALARRTGNAAASIYQRTFSGAGRVTGVIGSALKYVAAHEYGATIYGSPWLYIPTGVAKPPVIRKRSVTLRPRRMFATGGAAATPDMQRVMRNAIVQGVRG